MEEPVIGPIKIEAKKTTEPIERPAYTFFS